MAVLIDSPGAHHALLRTARPDLQIDRVEEQHDQVDVVERAAAERVKPLAQLGLVESVAFSPDGTSFAVGSTDATSCLWDLQSRKRLGDPFPPYPGAVPAVAFEPNGRLLIIPLANAYEWPTDVSSWERFACRIAGREFTPQEWHLLPNRAYRPICQQT